MRRVAATTRPARLADQELATAGAPRPIGAYNLVTVPLLRHGTPDQQRRLCPPMNGDLRST